MKVMTLFCALIIGMVLGAGLTHKSQLGSAISALAASHDQPTAQEQPIPQAEYASTGATLPSSAQASTVIERTVVQSNPEDAEKMLKLESDFIKLSKKHEYLSSQLLEANRELQSLRFIVDTHSESFRPLRSEQNRQDNNSFAPPSGLSPLLPPRD